MEPSAVGAGITNCFAFLWALLREAPVLAVAILLFAILSGFGRGLGLPLLFWRATHGQPGEKARARFVVGYAAGEPGSAGPAEARAAVRAALRAADLPPEG